jgi:hypothetical protein
MVDSSAAVRDVIDSVTASESDHVAYEDLAAFVDRTADEVTAEIVRSHTEVCATCLRELRDLQAFAAPKRARWPYAAAAAVVIVAIAAAWELRPVETIRDNGREIALYSNGRMTHVAADVAAAVASGTVPVRSFSDLRSSDSMLRGASEPSRFQLHSPFGCVVTTREPRFEWSALGGAKYRVEIFDDRFHPIETSEIVNRTSWTATSPLGYGRLYVWQVTAVLPNGDTITEPAPPLTMARFRVIDERSDRELREQKRQTHPSHLALAVVYGRAGAREDASRELSALARENPRSDLVARLLASIRQ